MVVFSVFPLKFSKKGLKEKVYLSWTVLVHSNLHKARYSFKCLAGIFWVRVLFFALDVRFLIPSISYLLYQRTDVSRAISCYVVLADILLDWILRCHQLNLLVAATTEIERRLSAPATSKHICPSGRSCWRRQRLLRFLVDLASVAGNCSKTKTWIRFQSEWVTEPGPFLIITNMSPNYPIFREFFESLRLEWTDFIFVTILANHEVRVVVFDAIEDSERTFEWL
ncbi:hypothetical protein RHMOL_Rhmol06G0145300 [Rhododendron molle]|uniref:Uncharacterized protein n=1 Tax=Rhododendron molle TaxID=49168 RepID=A0ACC0NEL5_RHOML|nr:hypothetical protein RHMOL_Rhmol06G0145300 [Rhododendron molle]